MGFKKLSDLCLMRLFCFYGVNKKQILYQIITREVENANNENRRISQDLDIVVDHAEKLDDNKDKVSPNHWFILSQLCCSKGNIEEAERYYKKGVSMTINKINSESRIDLKKQIKEVYTIASWNFSCQLLKYGKMDLGWKLFDHGLNTPAEGIQKWQRALFKPFSSTKVRPWRGDDLSGKTILLLGEQGIGDTMAFMTLIQPIISQAKKVYIIVPVRLHKIYTRSFEECIVYTDKEVRDNSLDERLFDYQCPLGSVPQYLYKNLESFKSRRFQIKANLENAKRLRINTNQKIIKIIGISWQVEEEKTDLKINRLT